MLARPACSRYTLEAGPRCIHGAAAWARVHGGKGKLTGDLSKKEAMRFPSAGDGAVPASAPARRRSGDWSFRKGAAAVVLRARGGEKARVLGGRRASPAPLFIGEAW